MRKERLEINWNVDSEWHNGREMEKLEKVIADKDFKFENETENQIFKDIAHHTGCIFAEESTEELYKLFGYLWAICSQHLEDSD